MPCLVRAASSNPRRELNMMSPVSIAAMAFSLSVDALLAAIGRGSGSTRPDLREALRTGLVFGAIEAITPIFGWAVGIAASRFVESVDHWIAFGLLGLVGGNMILRGFRASHEDGPGRDGSLLVLFATAIGTSVDAFAVGISLAFLKVNIMIMAAAIGGATFVLSTAGMMAGRYIGMRFGRLAEIAGGVALMALGSSILHAHLTAA
jgi:manganese efflux pump family protein